ncbi:hypothetical protein GUJ93_ZPchr0004g38408 [Zizania palustris]|uniref:Uncharacterized protein n=1 Tax=Zizania palustris TaxID=103762 RepID=A0A8J5SEF2_ZIZPA|nr:hypothetical protein GUJ93_ZPchr0004g38408 [Zizania palustris]
MSIKTLLDLSEFSMEELIVQLKTTKEHCDFGGGSGSIANLNLMEDELDTRVAVNMQISGGGSSGQSKGSSS